MWKVLSFVLLRWNTMSCIQAAAEAHDQKPTLIISHIHRTIWKLKVFALTLYGSVRTTPATLQKRVIVEVKVRKNIIMPASLKPRWYHKWTRPRTAVNQRRCVHNCKNTLHMPKSPLTCQASPGLEVPDSESPKEGSSG